MSVLLNVRCNHIFGHFKLYQLYKPVIYTKANGISVDSKKYFGNTIVSLFINKKDKNWQLQFNFQIHLCQRGHARTFQRPGPKPDGRCSKPRHLLLDLLDRQAQRGRKPSQEQSWYSICACHLSCCSRSEFVSKLIVRESRFTNKIKVLYIIF